MENEELLNGISKIIVDSPNMKKLGDIVNESSVKNTKEVHIASIIDNYVKFTEDFIKDNSLIKKKEEILDYLHNQGYKTNLD
jgi:hypothetical protein